MKKWVTIGVMLIVAWIVLKIVLKLAGFAFHLLLIAGLIFLVYSLIKRASGTMRRRV